MKAKTFFILFLILIAGIFSANASRSDTVWTSYHWDGYKVSILGGDLYHYMKSKVRITADDPKEEITVSVKDGTIEKIDQNYYYINPGAQTYLFLSVNEKTFRIQVFNIPEPEVFLTKDTHKWKVINSYGSKVTPISKEDFLASSGIEAINKFTKFRVTSFTIAFNSNGDFVSMNIGGDKFSDEHKKKMQVIKNGQLFYLEDIKVLYPDGRTNTLMSKSYQIVDSYENEFIRQTVKYKEHSYDLGLMQTDLRIKLSGNVSKENIQTVSDFTDELNQLLETIQVKLVDNQPNLTIIMDSVVDSALFKQGFEEAEGWGLIKREKNFIFPFYDNYILHFPTDLYNISKESIDILLKRVILHLLGNFNTVTPDSSILHINYNYNHLSPYDKYMLKTLYSANGEYSVGKIIDKDFDNTDRTFIYIFLLMLTLCLSFVFIEIYKYFGIHRMLSKMKFQVIIRIVESFLLAQVPALSFIILISLDLHWIELPITLTFETYFVPLYILWGLFFLSIDTLLKKIKKYGLQLLLNFFLSFISVILAYQILYLFISPQSLNEIVMGWKLIVIPFILTFYRMILSFQKNKISGLLQEKELELSKQKELKFRSDLNALQARINPHFLYNALNSIASLSHIDANRTEKMALSLSKLFRYNTNKENEITATLKEEVEMAEVYLEVEKHRFDDRLKYSIELDPVLQSFIIPKFILQPLVENAVKHGVSKITTQGIIKIHIFESEGKVLIDVSDNGPAFPDGLISGYGLQNTYEKLKLLYKKPFDIEFINEPEKKIRISLTK